MKAKFLYGGSGGGVEYEKMLPEIMKGILKQFMKVLGKN